MDNQHRPDSGLWRKPTVKAFAGINADSTLYEWVAKGLFPKPVKIGPRASAWLVDEVMAWKASLVAERDGVTAQPAA